MLLSFWYSQVLSYCKLHLRYQRFLISEDWIALKTKDGKFRESVAALILVDSSPIRKIVRIFYRSLLALVRFPLNVTQYKVLYNARVALRCPYHPYNMEGSSKGALIRDEISLDLSALLSQCALS